MFQAVPQQYPVQLSPSPPIDTMPTLPPSAMVTMTATGEQKPRKLRASCDACSRAKVRCDKIRPTCNRCGNMGICCNYSPSMRLGKPRKHRNPDGSIRRDASPASSCGPMPLGPRPAELIPRTTSYTPGSSPEPSDPFFFAPPTPEYHYQDAFMSNGFDGSQSPAYSEAGSFASGWSNDDQLSMFQSPTDMFTSVPSLPPSASAFGHSRNTSTQSQPEMFAPIDSLTNSPQMGSPHFYPVQDHSVLMFPQEKMASPPPMLQQAPLPTPPVSASRASHDCTQSAFQTLNSLLAPPVSQPSNGDFNNVSSGLPTLDTVLSTTKAAVDKLFVLLGCPCAANPHLSTTVSFTITKILAWYQAVAGMNQPPTENSVTQLEAFTYTPMSVGAFRLEGEDDDTLRTQHILGELRRIEKLVDKFQERYCKAANPAETGIDSSVYESLEQLLRTRVRDTFKITMKNAPEEVKRHLANRTQHQRSRTCTI